MPITRTPIYDDSGQGTDGTVIDNAWKQEFYNQIDGALLASVGASASYTPVWTASVNPVVGNGSLLGRYVQLGPLIVAQIQLTWGSTTTGGSGGWILTLPTVFLNTAPLVSGLLLHGSAYTQLGGYPIGNSAINPFTTAPGVPAVALSATAPFTWAAGDTAQLWLLYEKG
jgi:hypothetical protein